MDAGWGEDGGETIQELQDQDRPIQESGRELKGQ